MMMATFHLQIVTPDRLVLDTQAKQIILRTVDGDVCILPNHIDYAAAIGIGEAKVTMEDGTVKTAACSGGLLSVQNGCVRVMATTFEWADEIDLSRAELAQQKAEEKLAGMDREDKDYARMEAHLKRAITRIHVKR